MRYHKLTLAKVQQLAKKIYKESGPNRRVIGLVGTLGSGKTTFTKALAEAMGVKDAKSPTFVVMHCYLKAGKSLYHLDLYRLEKAKELEALGLDEILEDEENLMVIEWVDKFPQLAKRCDLIITFEITKDNKRNVTVKAN